MRNTPTNFQTFWTLLNAMADKSHHIEDSVLFRVKILADLLPESNLQVEATPPL